MNYMNPAYSSIYGDPCQEAGRRMYQLAVQLNFNVWDPREAAFGAGEHDDKLDRLAATVTKPQRL